MFWLIAPVKRQEVFDIKVFSLIVELKFLYDFL